MGALTKISKHLSWRMNFMFISTVTFIASQICRTYCESTYKKGHLYTITAVDIHGKSIPLSAFKGKVLLVVNVATYCGFTQDHYKELVAIQKKLGSKKFTVLAFPCNQFGEQEPDTNEEIIEFLTQMYKVNFPVFQKIDVIKGNAHKLYKFITDQSGNSPNWNFWKYLIDHKGNIVDAYPPTTTVESLTSKIHTLIEEIPSRMDEL